MLRYLIPLAALQITLCSALAHCPKVPTPLPLAKLRETHKIDARTRYRQLVDAYQEIAAQLHNPDLTTLHRAILQNGAKVIATEAREIERAKIEVSGRRQRTGK